MLDLNHGTLERLIRTRYWQPEENPKGTCTVGTLAVCNLACPPSPCADSTRLERRAERGVFFIAHGSTMTGVARLEAALSARSTRRTRTVAMVSALSNRPVRRAVAMSGDVSLKGRVSAVGGVPQKVVAAYKRGRKVVILPKANARDLERVPREILDALDIRLVSTASEAPRAALTD